MKPILIIDDNYRDRTYLAKLLESLGHKTTISPDLKDAILKIKTGSFVLIIVSFDISGTHPLEFIKQAKTENESNTVLMISSHPSVENAVESMKAGAIDFLIKPVESDHMRILLDKVLTTKDEEQPDKSSIMPTTQIVTQDKTMRYLLEIIQKVANSNASILIQGESGTGKELFARFVHENSKRVKSKFLAINCAALPESLLESELFGHEKGSFTGAIAKKLGKFELASSGTLLLDEITEMQIHLQSKLLRVIQEKELMRVGGEQTIKVDVRVIATTNRDIKEAIDQGTFREDLYYRLNVIPIKIPPLRQRQGDIPLLANYFVDKYNRFDGRNVKGLTPTALLALGKYPFYGNVREMENVIHRSVLLCNGEWIDVDDLFFEETGAAINKKNDEHNYGDLSTSDLPNSLPNNILSGSLRDIEEKLIFHTLDKTSGNRTHAAKILGISVRTLRNKLNEYKEKKF
ncbi:MAG: sigma-54-dependent Fis family transcriptional regulator [Desulfobacterales bacterium]|nr:sigma-54-dependent Fis family transcriptional regulator [Desulfobacterales bacterium]